MTNILKTVAKYPPTKETGAYKGQQTVSRIEQAQAKKEEEIKAHKNRVLGN
jgi:hypothetical protein